MEQQNLKAGLKAMYHPRASLKACPAVRFGEDAHLRPDILIEREANCGKRFQELDARIWVQQLNLPPCRRHREGREMFLSVRSLDWLIYSKCSLVTRETPRSLINNLHFVCHSEVEKSHSNQYAKVLHSTSARSRLPDRDAPSRHFQSRSWCLGFVYLLIPDTDLIPLLN